MKKFRLIISLIAIVLCFSMFSTTSFAASVPVYSYGDTNGDKEIDIRDLVHAYVMYTEQNTTPSAADWDFDEKPDFSEIRTAIMEDRQFSFSIDSDSFETIINPQSLG